MKSQIKNFSHKIFVFYRKWEVKNNVVLDVRSAAHHEAFLIKQGMLFLHVFNVLGMRVWSQASYAKVWEFTTAHSWQPESNMEPLAHAL